MQFLAGKQAGDGAWHSSTYGSLRDGAAVTAVALYAASHAPPEARSAIKAEAALEYLRLGIKKKRFVCNPDGSLDYPTYSSAMLLVAAPRLGLKLSAEEKQGLVDLLLKTQLTEQREFEKGSIHYGGWDLHGGANVLGITSGSNISLAVYVLEALHEIDSEEAKASREHALAWAIRCQSVSTDGGFFFTPEKQSASNKAAWADKLEQVPSSYGTATADGLRCLHYCGVNKTEEHFSAAAKWLAREANLEKVPGFEETEGQENWATGLRFYYYASLAKALPLLPEETAKPRRLALIGQIVSLQKEDGSWQNESARMREDDPLIATSLALTALGSLLSP